MIIRHDVTCSNIKALEIKDKMCDCVNLCCDNITIISHVFHTFDCHSYYNASLNNAPLDLNID